jgi:Sulfite exporter TauE/SafE/Pyridoxamine 5'-phosphate oxidase
MAAETAGLRDLLRSQRVFPDRMPVFDPYAVPGDPVTLFLRWLEAAIRDAVPAPQAMTVATADDQGRPSSRVLICKDVDGEGRWYWPTGIALGIGGIAGGYLGARMQHRLPDTRIRRTVGILASAIAATFLWSGLS